MAFSNYSSKITEIFDLLTDVCKNGSVRKIEISRSFIGDALPTQQDAIIRGLLTVAPYIQSLDLSCNRLEGLGFEKLKNLFISLSNITTLACLQLDDNEFSCEGSSLSSSQQIINLFTALMSGKRASGQKWQLLSVHNTGIGDLETNEWVTLLNLLDTACIGVDLSYNKLQDITNENLFLLEGDDVVDILVRWLKDTPLRLIYLEHNGFSKNNTSRILEVASSNIGIEVKTTKGNNTENNELYYTQLSSMQRQSMGREEAERLGGSPVILSSILSSEPSVLQHEVSTNTTNNENLAFLINILQILSSGGILIQQMDDDYLRRLDTASLREQIKKIVEEGHSIIAKPAKPVISS